MTHTHPQSMMAVGVYAVVYFLVYRWHYRAIFYVPAHKQDFIMPNQTQIQGLKASLTALTTAIKIAAAKVRATAFFSDKADTLGGQTIAQVRTQLDASLAAHTANLNLPHGETAASIGIPTKAVVDAQMAKLVPSGVLPISRFGSLNYLPVGVGGSYESGTHIGSASYMRVPIHMEQDGTLVYLRNGTDGSTQGVFYSYLQNAKTADIRTTVLSNKKYRPPFIPVDMEVKRVYLGNGGVLIGEAHRTSDLGGLQVFVALCNDTFDDSKHTGSLIPLSVINPAINSDHQSWEPILIAGTIYLIKAINGLYGPSSGEAECSLSVKTLLASEVAAGTVTTLPTITGWNVVGPKQTRNNHPNILLSAKVASTNPADDAMFYYPATGVVINNWWPSYGAGSLTNSQVDKATGKIRTIVAGLIRLSPSATLGISPGIGFSLVIDPIAKTAVLDTEYAGGCIFDFNAARNGVTFSNTAYSIGVEPQYNPSLSYSGKNIVMTNDGYVICMGISSVTEQINQLRRARLTGFTTPFNYIPGQNKGSSTISSTAIAAAGPTPFMNGYRAINLLPNGYIMAKSKGTGVNWVRARARYALPGEEPNFTYKSISGADLKGYSPKSDRKLISEIPGAVETSALLTEMNATAVTACRGAVLTTAIPSRQLDFNDAMVPTGSILSVVPATLAAAGVAAYAAAGYPGTAKNIFVQLNVPLNPLARPILTIWALQPDGTQCAAVFLATVTNRTGGVGAVTVGTLIGKATSGVTTNAAFGSTSIEMVGGSTITEMEGGFAYTVCGFGLWALSGGSQLNAWKFFLNNDGTVEGFANNQYTPDYNAAHYFAMPGLGIGTIRVDVPDSDFSTKLQFASVGKDKAAVVNWKTITRDDKIVILAQQAPVGWNVYFTDPTPLFMAGNPYTLGVSSVDLMDITPNPANKKFYIYVQLVLGVPRYVIRETEVNDSETTMYVGYITTGPIAITAIVVDKVDRIGTFRISNTPIGSAIPTSSGHPADIGKLTWT